MKRTLIQSVGLASLLSCLMGAQGRPPTVTAAGEVLEGVWSGPGAAVFRGIPYAAAPVGDLRWRPPAPHRPRNGPQSAKSFSPVCVQTERLTAWEKSIAMVFGTQDQVDATPRNSNEDCLYLNVWTNNLGGKTPQPVMVWVHGGSNVAGEGSSPWYDGAMLAKRGVVVVTINYRLGVFGFLALPALSAESPDRVSGNYALLDQLAALRWVRANITQFGGDPDRVTIFGESAGSLDLVALMASPLSAGLFHRAIAQSGAPMGTALLLAQAEAQGTGFAEASGGETTGGPAVALRRKPAAELLQLADQQVLAGKLQIQPVIDGWLLPDAPGRIFSSGKQRKVPLIIGSNAREMTTLRSFLPRIERTVPAYRGWLRQTVGADAERFSELYPARSDADVEGALIDATTDSLFTCPARFAARAMARVGVPAYLYQFTRVRPRGQSLGAYHAAEITHVFETRLPWLPWEPVDDQLSAAMAKYWAAFAATGTPAAEGLPTWPPHDAAGDRYLELGPATEAKAGLQKSACDVLDSVYPRLWGPGFAGGAGSTQRSAKDENLSGTIVSSKRMADGKEWTTANLNVNTPSSYCSDDAEPNCARHGRLYTWESAQGGCQSLGEGWRLPTDDEWRQLAKHYGGVGNDSPDKGKAAYTALLSGGTSGFNAVLAGNRSIDGKYERLEAHGFYWTASENDPITAPFYNFGKGSQGLYRQPQGQKQMAVSARCVRP